MSGNGLIVLLFDLAPMPLLVNQDRFLGATVQTRGTNHICSCVANSRWAVDLSIGVKCLVVHLI
jgi:hypothetical protein